MEVVVTGIGLFSALGERDKTWKRLLAGETAIQAHQPFSDLPFRPLAMMDDQPAELTMLTRQVVLSAIADAELDLPLPECGVAIGSSRGQQAQWERLVARMQDVDRISDSAELTHWLGSHWLESFPQAAATEASRTIGSQAAVLSPMSACATGLWAIVQGVELVRTGRYERVVAGAIETPITRLTLTGFERMGALAQTGAYPFDRDRQGLVLGEGGAVLVLESASSAQQRHAKIYGRVLGFGLTADAHHISAPAPDRKAAIAAVQQCLQRSGLAPQDVDFIHAHGTATQLNDYHEAQLIQTLFPRSVPISSTKGATGHTIGASGAIGAAISLMALQQQLLPPCVGLSHPAFDLDLVRAARPANLQNVLCFSFGFGGQNAAIALSRV